jgi:PKD domain
MHIVKVFIGGVVLCVGISVAHAAEFSDEGDVEPTTPVTGYSIKRGTTASPLPKNVESPSPTPSVISAENIPPSASAGRDQLVTSGALVVLSASASTDSDGSIVSYVWKQISGTPVDLLSSRTPTPSFSAKDVGSYIFQLTVRDNEGMTAIDVVTVAVRPAPSIVPTIPPMLTPVPTPTPEPVLASLVQNSNLILVALGVILIALLSVIGRVLFKSPVP